MPTWLKSLLGGLSLAAVLGYLLKKAADFAFDWFKQRRADKKDEARFLVDFREYYDQEMQRHSHQYVKRIEVNGTGTTKQRDPVRQIEEWVDGPSRFLILSGGGSIGKSRCCIEAARHKKMKWIFLKGYVVTPDDLKEGLDRFVRRNSVYVYEDYEEYPSDTFRKVVDVTFRKKARLLAVSTDEEGPKRAISTSNRVSTDFIQLIQLRNLTGQSIELMVRDRARLARQIELDSTTLDNIVSISEGLPGVGLLAFDLYARKRTLPAIQTPEHLLGYIYRNCEDRLGSQWEALKHHIGRLSLVRAGSLLAEQYEQIKIGMFDGLLVKDKSGSFRLQPTVLSDYFARKCYFEDGSTHEFESVVDEFISTKSREILTTLINCNQKKAVAILLGKAKQLDAKTVLDLGIKAYEAFRDATLVQTHLGDFWQRVWELNDPDDFHKTALVLCSFGKWDEAEKCWNRAIVLCKERNNYWGEGLTYNNLGSMYLQRNNWEKADEFQRKALESFGHIQKDLREWGPFGLAQTYNELALIYRNKGNWAKAIQNLELSLGEFSKLKGHYGAFCRANANLILGSILHSVGDWNQAMHYYQAACEMYEGLGVASGLANAYSALSLAYADRRDWDTANEFFQKSMSTLQRVGDLHGIARIYRDFGTLYFRKSDWANAESFYRKSGDICKQLGNATGIAEAFTGLAWIYQAKGEWNQAIECFEDAKKTYDELGDANGSAQTQSGLASVYLGRADWDRALQLYQTSKQIFEKMGDRNQAASTLLNLGLVYRQRGDYPRAIDLYEEARRIFEEIGNQLGISNSYMQLGAVHQEKSENDVALQFYEESLRLSEEIGNVRDELNAQVAIASIHHNLGEWDVAIEVYERALKAYTQLGDRFGIVYVQMNIGAVHIGKGEWEKAIQSYQQAFEISEKLQNTHEKANAQSGLADIAEKRGDWDVAAQIYESALDVFRSLGDRRGMAARRHDLAFICSRKGDWNQAIQHCEESRSIYDQIGDPQGIASTFLIRGLIHNEAGNHKEAIESYEQALKLYDQLGVRAGMAAVYNNTGLAFEKLREYEEAVRVLTLSMELSDSLGDRQLKSYSLTILGMVHSDRGEWDAAEQCYAKSLEIKKELGDPYGIAWTQGEMGAMHMRKGELQMAQQILFTSFRSFTRLGAKADASRVKGYLLDLLKTYQAKGDTLLAKEIQKEL